MGGGGKNRVALVGAEDICFMGRLIGRGESGQGWRCKGLGMQSRYFIRYLWQMSSWGRNSALRGLHRLFGGTTMRSSIHCNLSMDGLLRSLLRRKLNAHMVYCSVSLLLLAWFTC